MSAPAVCARRPSGTARTCPVNSRPSSVSTSAGGRAVRHGGEGVDVLGVDPEAGQEVEYRFQARTDGETALGRQAADEEAGSVLERARLHADGSAPFPSPPRSNGGGPRS
jgi:hypothetical protein